MDGTIHTCSIELRKLKVIHWHFENIYYCQTLYLFLYSDADDTVRQKRERLLEKAKKRVMNSALMKDLQREYTDGPEEITVLFFLQI